MRALLIVCTLLTNTLFGQVDLLKEIRANISEVFNSEAECKRMYDAFERTNISQDHLLEGYKGAVSMGMASHTSNPFGRYGHFTNGKKLLERAISKEPNSIELRFLRLTIQTNLPSFLGYGDDKDGDKTFVVAHLDEVHIEMVKQRMRDFIAKAEEEGKL